MEAEQLNRFLAELADESTQPILDERLLERGIVLKTHIYEDSNCNVSLLTLFPNAKIRKHQHTDDKEWYVDIAKQRITVCPKGGEHELENSSETELMFILALKYKC